MDDDHAARVHQRAVHVADDGGPIGVLDVEHADDHLVIENVAVHPERQGAGVGRALLNFAEELARVFGVDTIRLHTHALMTENRALYAGRGFVETGRRPLDGGAGGELVLMAKRLEPPSAPH
jgi:GNAT superfamily N-acetyltransferase